MLYLNGKHEIRCQISNALEFPNKILCNFQKSFVPNLTQYVLCSKINCVCGLLCPDRIAQFQRSTLHVPSPELKSTNPNLNPNPYRSSAEKCRPCCAAAAMVLPLCCCYCFALGEFSGCQVQVPIAMASTYRTPRLAPTSPPRTPGTTLFTVCSRRAEKPALQPTSLPHLAETEGSWQLLQLLVISVLTRDVNALGRSCLMAQPRCVDQKRQRKSAGHPVHIFIYILAES